MKILFDYKIFYQLFIDNSEYDISELAYGNERSPSIVIPKTLTHVLHGSCRNPHHFSEDSLFSADQLLETYREHGELGPTLLLMSGDQIYADDVAGPMLMAIHALIKKLGIFKEKPKRRIRLLQRRKENNGFLG